MNLSIGLILEIPLFTLTRFNHKTFTKRRPSAEHDRRTSIA